MVTDASFPVVMPCLSTSKGTSCLDAVFCLLRWGRRICRVGIFPKGFPMPGARGWGPFPSSYRRRPEGYDRASIRPTERKSEKHRRGCGCGECTGPCALHREVHREREREREERKRERDTAKQSKETQTDIRRESKLLSFFIFAREFSLCVALACAWAQAQGSPQSPASLLHRT